MDPDPGGIQLCEDCSRGTHSLTTPARVGSPDFSGGFHKESQARLGG
jgi:hypothetical protein